MLCILFKNLNQTTLTLKTLSNSNGSIICRGPQFSDFCSHNIGYVWGVDQRLTLRWRQEHKNWTKNKIYVYEKRFQAKKNSILPSQHSQFWEIGQKSFSQTSIKKRLQIFAYILEIGLQKAWWSLFFRFFGQKNVAHFFVPKNVVLGKYSYEIPRNLIC